jgi:tetratricopeptide (TPR) repeat protein
VRGLWQPGPAEVSMLKAGVLLELGRHAKALAAAEAALEEAPDAPAARLLRARANLELDRPELALGDLDAAASRGEDVGELRSIAVGALMQRPRELWPEDVGEDEVARALYGDSLLAASIPGVELDAMALARKLGPQERPLWLTACRYRQEMLRRVVLLLTSEQLVWTGPRTQGELAWSEAREVRALPPKGMRIVLRSGRRLEFPGIADEGTALTEEGEPLDADGVRRLAETLTREAAG